MPSLWLIDAFTDAPFKGNPAGVCHLTGPVPDQWMQSLAAEMNQAETAFVLAEGDGFRLRWFTPAAEVDLYEPRAAIGHWIASDSAQGFAIVDERLMPDEVRSRVEVIARFGSAAVIMRPGASTCVK